MLCEKPLTLNARQAEAIVDLAREHDLFLMEAMWMACHPVIRAAARRLAAGRFGTPRQVHADLGFVVDRPADRPARSTPALGGGALLDMGIYPLTFAHLMLGEAEALTATAVAHRAGIDLDVAIAGALPGRRGRGADRLDDLDVAALTATIATDRGPHRAARAASTTRRTSCGRRPAASPERLGGRRAAARLRATATRRPRCSALPGRRAPREPAGAARADARADAADGRDPRRRSAWSTRVTTIPPDG